jgi:hypothetical protein
MLKKSVLLFMIAAATAAVAEAKIKVTTITSWGSSIVTWINSPIDDEITIDLRN